MITPRRAIARKSAEKNTAEAVAISTNARAMSDLVRLYICTNGGGQERRFAKRLVPSKCEAPYLIGFGTDELFYDVDADCLVKFRKRFERFEGVSLIIKIVRQSDVVHVTVPHKENKTWSDAITMEIKGTDAALTEFYLTTSLERSAVKWKDASVSNVHLWTMRIMELIALRFGANTLSLFDAASTRIKHWVNNKQYIFIDIPNRSALLKIRKDDYRAHTYERYGFHPVRRPPMYDRYTSSNASINTFLANCDLSFPLLFLTQEEMRTPLVALVKDLMSRVRNELRSQAFSSKGIHDES